MIKIYIKFFVNSNGDSPRKLVDRLRKIGGVPLIGEYDIEIELDENVRLFHKLEAIHRALKGSGVIYSVSTGVEGADKITTPMKLSDSKNIAMKKRFYAAKIARWKEMGLDTSGLEVLLEKDIDKFKEVSQAYIRDHLEKSQVIEGSEKDLKSVDEDVLATIDDLGVSIKSIWKLCDLSENEVMVSLGRLISAGKVKRIRKDGENVYVRLKTVIRKKPVQEILPAKSPAEATQRVLSAIRTKGSTVKHICRDARLPENQVMDALAELLKSNRLRSAKRGRGTVYLRVPGK